MDVENRRDEELLDGHRRGERACFELLVRRYSEELFAFLQRFVGSAAVADDLVQETFLQVHLAADAYDRDRPFRPWLYTIAANKARDYLRGKGRRTEQSLDVRGPDDDGPGPSQLVAAPAGTDEAAEDTTELQEQVRGVIARMPEHLQLILVLGYYQRLPYSEIAEILEIPVGTVKSRLHAAVTRFARLWQARNPTARPAH